MKCPKGTSDWMRSQMILVTASIGVAEDRTRDAPHPVPEHQRYNDEHRIDRETARKQHWRDGLAFDEVNDQIECRGQEGQP